MSGGGAVPLGAVSIGWSVICVPGGTVANGVTSAKFCTWPLPSGIGRRGCCFAVSSGTVTVSKFPAADFKSSRTGGDISGAMLIAGAGMVGAACKAGGCKIPGSDGGTTAITCAVRGRTGAAIAVGTVGARGATGDKGGAPGIAALGAIRPVGKAALTVWISAPISPAFWAGFACIAGDAAAGVECASALTGISVTIAPTARRGGAAAADAAAGVVCNAACAPPTGSAASAGPAPICAVP